MHETTTKILEATSWLSEQLRPIVQTPPLPAVYAADPTVYARVNYEGAMQRLTDGERRLLLVGMNPGPHGMAQTGVPFGDVQNARIILRRGIQFKEGQPWVGHKIVSPLGPVILDAKGLDYQRGEVSGERLWGGLDQIFGGLERAYSRLCVINYCPLVFLGPTGRNVTPSELPKTGLYRDMIAACDEHLRRVVNALGVRVVVGIGNYSYDRCRIALASAALPVVKVPHPSPRNPSAAVSWLSDATKIIHDADTLAHQVQ